MKDRFDNVFLRRGNVARLHKEVVDSADTYSEAMNKEAVERIKILRDYIVKKSDDPEKTRLYVDGMLIAAISFTLNPTNPWDIKDALDLNKWMMPPTEPKP